MNRRMVRRRSIVDRCNNTLFVLKTYITGAPSISTVLLLIFYANDDVLNVVLAPTDHSKVSAPTTNCTKNELGFRIPTLLYNTGGSKVLTADYPVLLMVY